MPWISTGSWYNDQTAGDQATFHGVDGNILYYTEPRAQRDPVYG